jgi:hypothetical protein
VLGGGAAPHAAAELFPVAVEINRAFFEGSPSAWTQSHLFTGSCPP